MTPTALRPGAEVDAWCTKCRMDLLHRIIAMRAGEVARVECRTCGGHHNFRKPKGPEQRRASVRTRVSEPGASLQHAQWQKAVSRGSPGAFQEYSAKHVYASGDLIRHQKFGDGYVVQVTDRHKIEAMFKDGPRTLAQALER